MFAEILESMKYNEYPSFSELLGKMVIPYGSNPGVYNFALTPFYSDILSQLDDKDTEVIGLQIASQSGKTQLLICIALAWCIKYGTPVYFCVPTKKVAEDHFLNKILPIVNSTPLLSNLLIRDETTGKVSKKTQKGLSVRFNGGGSLIMDFAGARTFLQSYSTSLLVLDEYDKIEASRRKGSSDLMENALARISSFASKNKHVLIGSTPTYPNFGVSKLREQSTQYVYKYACPSCGVVHEPDFYNLHLKDHKKDALTEAELGSQLRSITNDALLYLQCPDCKDPLWEWQKDSTKSKGYWEEVPNSSGRRDWVSYHVSGLFGLRKWKNVYQSWIGACIEYKGKAGTDKYRAFNNEVLGIPYELRLAPSLKLADIKLGDYLKGEHKDIHSISTGIDVQTEQKIIYVTVVGFGEAGKYALIDWYSRTWTTEQELLETIRSIHNAKFGSLSNKYTYVDTGGSMGTVIMDICRKVSYHACIGVKGSPRVRDWTYRGASTPENYKPLFIHPHKTNQRLDELIQNGLSFPVDFDDMIFFTHLKNEIPTIQKSEVIYKKISDHAPNDYRDALRYALFGGIYSGLEVKKAKVSFGW